MRAVDIIIKKRDQGELSGEEIRFFIEGYTRGDIPDYQASAWAMAVLLNGMTPRETTDLALAMAHSGDILDLSGTIEIAVDKHSTGGVGDKTTLVVAPVVAACGLSVGKMSGRGLGFSGGTLDKMESIPGYRTNLSTDEFVKQLRAEGIVLTGQSADLAPADGMLYALRDVTGTVQSIPLIASSVMSKKIAAGAQAILLDVKVGNGAFMKTLEDARKLASLMVEIGRLAGRETVALISDMNQPLGNAVGNALELHEAIETLHGGGPVDFREHCLVAAAHLLVLGRMARNVEDGMVQAESVLDSGNAWRRFHALVKAQGGDVSFIEKPNQLPRAKIIEEVRVARTGYMSGINTRVVGETCVLLGGGRAQKGDAIDFAVGIQVHHKVGDLIESGEKLFTIHANDQDRCNEARRILLDAISWSDGMVEPLPLFYEVVR